MPEPLDPMTVLAAIPEAIERGTHVGCTTRDIADVLEVSLADIDPELRQLAREKLANVTRDPMGSEWWSVAAGGLALLARNAPQAGQGSL